MRYEPSVDVFKGSVMFKQKALYTHLTGKSFLLFPFIANGSIPAVTDLEIVVGRYLCDIEQREVTPIFLPDLLNSPYISVEEDQKESFKKIIQNLFFNSDGSVKPTSFQLLKHIECKESLKKKIAEYLSDVLGEKEILREALRDASQEAVNSSNVLERFVLSQVDMSSACNAEKDRLHYFRIEDSLTKVYNEDFEYIVKDPLRARTYIIPLLEFYFFSYTAQTCLQLSRFMDGERNEIIPLYFCLEWEKTSQSRNCYSNGWAFLSKSLKTIFAHANTLEILNQTEDGSDVVDYIAIGESLKANPELDAVYAGKIDKLTECYRSVITDSTSMNEYVKECNYSRATDASIRYLFESVRLQFEEVRESPYSAYARQFDKFSDKFKKNRGRNGQMLNLNESTLIFLTKLAIKDKEKVRLNEIFSEFEKRGVFLDSISKQGVTEYFTKLNLIETKSDSGDAMYVRRIL